MEVSMKVTRFYATSDGESRFHEGEIRFVELPQGMVQGWHHAPASQIVVILSGVMEVGTSDNQKRQGRPGQAFIADDLTGKGHTTRVVDGPAHVMFVELPKGFDFGKWSA